jgi:hypothetical protein
MPVYNLKGRVAIVTGAGSGIGHAITELLLEAGCSVVLADLKLRPEAELILARYAHLPPGWNKSSDSDSDSDCDSETSNCSIPYHRRDELGTNPVPLGHNAGSGHRRKCRRRVRAPMEQLLERTGHLVRGSRPRRCIYRPVRDHRHQLHRAHPPGAACHRLLDPKSRE